MFTGNRLKKIAYALILTGVSLFIYLRHRQIEDRGTLHWFDRPIVLLTSPLSKGLHAIRDAVGSVFDRYFFLVGVEKENVELRRQVDEAKSGQAFHEETAKENKRLLDLLNLKHQLSGEWIAAQVVSTPAIAPFRILTINKGSDDGIERRAAVVAPDGLVGQVSRVFGHYSQVLLITDPTSAVDGRIEQTQSRALVIGKVMKLEMKRDLYITAFDYLNQTTEIAEGAKVVTSGMDGVYPPGLSIGWVHGSKKKKYDIFQQAEVIPSVDFYKLREVLVLKRTGSDKR